MLKLLFNEDIRFIFTATALAVLLLTIAHYDYMGDAIFACIMMIYLPCKLLNIHDVPLKKSLTLPAVLIALMVIWSPRLKDQLPQESLEKINAIQNNYITVNAEMLDDAGLPHGNLTQTEIEQKMGVLGVFLQQVSNNNISSETLSQARASVKALHENSAAINQKIKEKKLVDQSVDYDATVTWLEISLPSTLIFKYKIFAVKYIYVYLLYIALSIAAYMATGIFNRKEKGPLV